MDRFYRSSLNICKVSTALLSLNIILIFSHNVFAAVPHHPFVRRFWNLFKESAFTFHVEYQNKYTCGYISAVPGEKQPLANKREVWTFAFDDYFRHSLVVESKTVMKIRELDQRTLSVTLKEKNYPHQVSIVSIRSNEDGREFYLELSVPPEQIAVNSGIRPEDYVESDQVPGWYVLSFGKCVKTVETKNKEISEVVTASDRSDFVTKESTDVSSILSEFKKELSVSGGEAIFKVYERSRKTFLEEAVSRLEPILLGQIMELGKKNRALSQKLGKWQNSDQYTVLALIYKTLVDYPEKEDQFVDIAQEFAEFLIDHGSADLYLKLNTGETPFLLYCKTKTLPKAKTMSAHFYLQLRNRDENILANGAGYVKLLIQKRDELVAKFSQTDEDRVNKKDIQILENVEILIRELGRDQQKSLISIRWPKFKSNFEDYRKYVEYFMGHKHKNKYDKRWKTTLERLGF